MVPPSIASFSLKTVFLTINEAELYIAPPFPPLELSVKLDEIISAVPLLYTAEFLLMTLLENSTLLITKSFSFQTRALSTKLSENVLFNIFIKPELYMISLVSKPSNVQLLIIKVP